MNDQYISSYKSIALISLAALTACGGGSGSSSTTSPSATSDSFQAVPHPTNYVVTEMENRRSDQSLLCTKNKYNEFGLVIEHSLVTSGPDGQCFTDDDVLISSSITEPLAGHDTFNYVETVYSQSIPLPSNPSGKEVDYCVLMDVDENNPSVIKHSFSFFKSSDTSIVWNGGYPSLIDNSDNNEEFNCHITPDTLDNTFGVQMKRELALNSLGYPVAYNETSRQITGAELSNDMPFNASQVLLYAYENDDKTLATTWLNSTFTPETVFKTFQYDNLGRLVAIRLLGIGEDRVRETSDDVMLAYERFEFENNIRVRSFTYDSAGEDGDWDTTEDNNLVSRTRWAYFPTYPTNNK